MLFRLPGLQTICGETILKLSCLGDQKHSCTQVRICVTRVANSPSHCDYILWFALLLLWRPLLLHTLHKEKTSFNAHFRQNKSHTVSYLLHIHKNMPHVYVRTYTIGGMTLSVKSSSHRNQHTTDTTDLVLGSTLPSSSRTNNTSSSTHTLGLLNQNTR